MKIRVEWTTPEDSFAKEFSTYRKALDFFTKIRDGEEFWSTIEMWRLDKEKPELMAIEEKDNYTIMKHVKANEKLELDEDSIEEELSDDISKFINDIYELRKTSIAQDGEYGLGNLVFKEFRNRGYLDNLKELRKIEKGKELSLEGLDKKLVEDLSSDDFWNLRNIDLDIEGNLIQDGDTIRPITKEELSNNYAVSIEHADKEDFKSKEEIEKVEKETDALRVMFFYMPNENYSGEYSLLYGDEKVAKKVGKEYKQYSYARFDEGGNYHEEVLEETK